MKIAVTSTGKTLESEVDQRFGRAAYFVIVDTDLLIFRAIENDNIAAAGGAGVASAKLVIDAGTEVAITGNCGPNAERTLRAAGIKVYTGAKGTVGEAIELFKNGKLAKAAGPNVQSHFGIQR
jgi:predicted Fe-Mo cluster-binding NifX family protein